MSRVARILGTELFVGLFPHSESLIVKRLTGFKNSLKSLTLFGRRIDTVLVCYKHCDSTFWFRKHSPTKANTIVPDSHCLFNKKRGAVETPL